MRYRDIILARALGKGKRGMAVGWPLMLGVAGGGGTETTITGVSPLLLAAALKKPLKSLTQYGLCTQADTPTPASPVPIMCNNGAVQMVDDELPAGYKRVLGFSMNNNAYWEIADFPLYGSDTLRFAFEATDACNVIGAYSGSASGNNYSLYVSTSSNYLRYKSGAYNSAINFDTRYDVEITPTGSNGMKTDSSWTAQTFTTPTNLCIGTTATSASSAKLKGKLYGNIEVVGRAKFVPCERVSDNVLGYYDTYSETFYEPYTGYDGAVSLGYDGSHYSLAVVGTDEVISITASGAASQTASAPDLYAVGDYADEVNIISGAVTRKVVARRLTSDETGWALSKSGDTYRYRCRLDDAAYKSGRGTDVLCSHAAAAATGSPVNSVFLNGSSNVEYLFFVPDQTIQTVDDFKDWLNENPVIVIYPLAEETTESVTAQPLETVAGDNTVSWTAAVSGKTMSAVYIKGAASNLVGSAIVGTAKAG